MVLPGGCAQPARGDRGTDGVGRRNTPRSDAGTSGSTQGLIAFSASEPAAGHITGGGSGGDRSRPIRIYVVNPDGTQRRAVTGASLLKGSLAWSPDGSMLAFTTFDLDRMRERLSVMSPTGAERRVVCTECTGTFWVAPEDEICIDGGCPKAAPFADRLTWSPDGRWLAAPSRHDGGLAIIEVATGEVHVTSELGPVSGTSWSPDGSELAVAVDGGSEGLYVVQVPDGAPTLLHPGDPYTGSAPAWSRDGSTIAFGQAVRAQGDLHAQLLFIDADDGSSRKILGPRALYEIYDLEWSPSGRSPRRPASPGRPADRRVAHRGHRWIRRPDGGAVRERPGRGSSVSVQRWRCGLVADGAQAGLPQLRRKELGVVGPQDRRTRGSDLR